MSTSILFLFLKIGYFLYISNVIPFPPETPYHILPAPASLKVSLHPSTHSHLPTLNSPTLGHLSSLHRTKDLSFHRCLTRPSSATYATRAMCTPLSMGVLGWRGGVWLVDIVVLPMGLQTPSTPSVPSLNSSIRDPTLSPIIGC